MNKSKFKVYIVKGSPSWENGEILQILPVKIDSHNNLSVDFKKPILLESHTQYYLEISSKT